jgi:RNA polymerase sigma factor (TIGR02999 family)
MSECSDDLSPTLKAAAAGSTAAVRQMGDSLYSELHRLAEYTMASERRDHTLQPSGLVHETFLRLIDQRNLPLDHRSKFLATAAGVMRRVLVDYARARNAKKRGGGQERDRLEVEELGFEEANRIDILAVDEALDQLAGQHERAARVVEMRFFSSMSNEEIAQELDVSTKTVQNDWVFAKAWLYRTISGGEARAPDSA